MFIRKAQIADLPEIMKIYEIARNYMRLNGNATQWESGYPAQSLIKKDISSDHFYVCEENNKIIGAFAFIIGLEPTYQEIQDGSWHNESLYGTIHRVASDGTTKGIAKACFDFCLSKIDYVRIDTHKNNLSMQTAIQKYGFSRCGIIHVANGSERIAFDYLKKATK